MWHVTIFVSVMKKKTEWNILQKIGQTFLLGLLIAILEDRQNKKFKTKIWKLLLHGCESWIPLPNIKMCLEAMEKWPWRRMTKTSCEEKKTNKTVLK